MFAGRIAIAAGTPLPPEQVVGGVTHVFPTAEQLSVAPLDTIGLTSLDAEPRCDGSPNWSRMESWICPDRQIVRPRSVRSCRSPVSVRGRRLTL